MFGLKKMSKGMLGIGKAGMRYRFEVQVVQLEGVPEGVECARVVMARSAKVAMTEVAVARKGTITFTKPLTMVVTMMKAKTGGFEVKPVTFKVQMPAGKNDEMATFGKTDIDMANFADAGPCGPDQRLLKIPFKLGSAKGTVTAQIVISSEPVAPGDDDGMSDMTGMESEYGRPSFVGNHPEQDLGGFDEAGGSGPGAGRRFPSLQVPAQRLASQPEESPMAKRLSASARTAPTAVPEENGFGKKKAQKLSPRTAEEEDHFWKKKVTPTAPAPAAVRRAADTDDEDEEEEAPPLPVTRAAASAGDGSSSKPKGLARFMQPAASAGAAAGGAASGGSHPGQQPPAAGATASAPTNTGAAAAAPASLAARSTPAWPAQPAAQAAPSTRAQPPSTPALVVGGSVAGASAAQQRNSGSANGAGGSSRQPRTSLADAYDDAELGAGLQKATARMGAGGAAAGAARAPAAGAAAAGKQPAGAAPAVAKGGAGSGGGGAAAATVRRSSSGADSGGGGGGVTAEDVAAYEATIARLRVECAAHERQLAASHAKLAASEQRAFAADTRLTASQVSARNAEGKLGGSDEALAASLAAIAAAELREKKLVKQLAAYKKREAETDAELHAFFGAKQARESELDSELAALLAAKQASEAAAASAAAAAAAAKADLERKLAKERARAAPPEESNDAAAGAERDAIWQKQMASLEAQLALECGARADAERKLSATATAALAAAATAAAASSAAVAGGALYLSKYNKLRERYAELEEVSAAEAVSLNARLEEAKMVSRELRLDLAAVMAAQPEADALAEENERLVVQLVNAQMVLAQVSEEKTKVRRDLLRAKEVNLQLADRLTRLVASAARQAKQANFSHA
ncbi:hypothetical protein FOA52_002198 [Chlamydomonas sp. UWO 241]|nr:hypothetical protein FOA52_002198 [Chlamydomonas sp. UWO 241]